MKIVSLFHGIFLLPVFFAGCTSGGSADGVPIVEEGERVFITDRTGSIWDITHAVRGHNMDPGFFNYGLGFGAIASVDQPLAVDRGSELYPVQRDLQVFGVDHNGEQRAYAVNDLAAHEVFNDTYPGESSRYLAITF